MNVGSRATLFTLAFGLASQTAWAHGQDARTVELFVRDREVELVATPPIEWLEAADDDADGRLSRSEVRAHRDALTATLLEAIVVTDGDEQPLAITGTDVSTPEHAEGSGASHLRFTVRGAFATPPSSVRVRASFPGDDESLRVVAARVAWSATPGLMELRGTRELARLDSAHPVAELLRVVPAPPLESSAEAAPNEAEVSVDLRIAAVLALIALPFSLWLLGAPFIHRSKRESV